MNSSPKLFIFRVMRSVIPIRRLRRRSPLETGNVAAAILLSLCVLIPLQARAASQPTASGPQLTYTKVLKGSTPEYERITVNLDGSGFYDGRRLADLPNPRPFQLSGSVTQNLFELAGRLHDFQDVSLESHKRVADLGLKTFKYVDGDRVYESQFNYSTNRNAAELTDLFEELGAVERHITALDYSMRFDHLGLPRELSLIQIDLNNKSLLDPQLMTATLESILHNPRYLHLAQLRAREILDRIQKSN